MIYKNYICLRYIRKCFDIHIHWEMVFTFKLISILITYLSSFGLKTYSLRSSLLANRMYHPTPFLQLTLIYSISSITTIYLHSLLTKGLMNSSFTSHLILELKFFNLEMRMCSTLRVEKLVIMAGRGCFEGGEC